MSIKTFSFDYAEYPDDVWYDVRQSPIKIYGLYEPLQNKRFFRIPESVAEATSEGVKGLNYNTAGGRLAFATDSPHIAIHAVMPEYHIMKHMPRSASAGFDVYIDDGKMQQYCGSIFPPAVTVEDYFHACNSFTVSGKVKNYVVNFPLYDSVDEVYVGLAPGSVLLPYDNAYTSDAPMIFYGSSITQGGCVSRPGLAYESYISRRFRRDFINLGFSGNGKAEDAIVDYMASLDMSVFVSDYDHNAPTVEYLEATHHKMYEKIRAAHPDVPYIMISRPDFDFHYDDSVRRRAVIRRSYERALENGDKNVYFIDGETLFGSDCRDACTVDSTHPNDLGHYRMACVIGDAIEKILKK